MISLHNSWKRTTKFLQKAYKSAHAPALEPFREFMVYNELELAADTLFEFGDVQADMPVTFWEALAQAYDNMELDSKEELCRLRIYEAKYGFVEARLTLTPKEAGGRSSPILNCFRPDWNIGSRTDSGEMVLNGARLTLEEADSLPPGATGLVRLHPFYPEAWSKLMPGTEIAMHEGARPIGKAIVLRVLLKKDRAAM